MKQEAQKLNESMGSSMRGNVPVVKLKKQQLVKTKLICKNYLKNIEKAS